MEAFLSRHWPEVGKFLDLDSVTLESLLIECGLPTRIAANAAKKMRGWGRSLLSDEKIESVIKSACHSLGLPCTAIEIRYLQALAEEMRHSRLQQKQAKKALEGFVQSDDGLKELSNLIGITTTAILLSCHLRTQKI